MERDNHGNVSNIFACSVHSGPTGYGHCRSSRMVPPGGGCSQQMAERSSPDMHLGKSSHKCSCTHHYILQLS